MTHASTQEAEAGSSLRFCGLPGVHSRILSQNKKLEKYGSWRFDTRMTLRLRFILNLVFLWRDRELFGLLRTKERKSSHLVVLRPESQSFCHMNTCGPLSLHRTWLGMSYRKDPFCLGLLSVPCVSLLPYGLLKGP